MVGGLVEVDLLVVVAAGLDLDGVDFTEGPANWKRQRKKRQFISPETFPVTDDNFQDARCFLPHHLHKKTINLP